MSRRKAADIEVRGDCRIRIDFCKPERKSFFVHFSRDPWYIEERFNLRGKCKEFIGTVIVKRLYTHMVTGAEEMVFVCIPDGKCEITEKVVKTGLPPALVGIHDEGTVRYDLSPPLKIEIRNELPAVVDPCVGSDGERPISTGEREVFVEGLGGCTEHTVTKADRPCLPCINPVRTPVGKSTGHP
jgi:hypothetical protein